MFNEKKRANILVLTGAYPKNDYSGIFIKHEVDALENKNYNLKVITRRGHLKQFKMFILAFKELLTKKYDIIHAHYLFPYGTMGAILSILFRKHLVITAHGSDVNVLLESKIYKKIIKWTLKRCSNLICVSYNLKNKIMKLNLPIKISINPCTVNTNKFKPLSRNYCIKKLNFDSKNKYLVYVGNLTENKRVDLIINAMPKVLSYYSNTHLVIIGNGDQKEKLVDLVNRFGLKNKVNFVDNVSNQDIPLYLNLADLFILVSKNEGTPLVATESCQCGTKVLITQPGELKLWKKYLPNLTILSEEDLKRLDHFIITELNKKSKFVVNKKFKDYFSLKESSNRLIKIYTELLLH